MWLGKMANEDVSGMLIRTLRTVLVLIALSAQVKISGCFMEAGKCWVRRERAKPGCTKAVLIFTAEVMRVF
jgi:hypothetical protein